MTGANRSEQPASPGSRRRLAVWLIVGFGLIFLLAGVIVSLVTGTAFSWGAIFLIGGVILFLFAGFVWIRLAEGG